MVSNEVFSGGADYAGDTNRYLRTLHRFKLLCGPHFAVLFHPGGTLGIPHLHGGKIVAGAGGFQHKALGVFTFAAGRATQNQRQHWGVYGAMPPSAKE